MAENPTSSSTMYTTLGAPSGALGGSNGAQSGTESLMSTLTVPLNALPIRPAPFGDLRGTPGPNRAPGFEPGALVQLPSSLALAAANSSSLSAPC